MDANLKDDEMKDEVVAAYNEVLRKLKVVKSDATADDMEESVQQKTELQLVENLSQETTDDFVHQITDLKSHISRSLDDLKNRLLPQYEKFHMLREAITFSESELDELYEIKVNVQSLSALLAAQKESREAYEVEMAERRKKFEDEMAQKEKAYRQEEHEYLTKRDATRRLEQEQFELKRQELEHELEEKKRTLEEEFEAREARIAARESEHQKLKHREAQITAREHEYKQLKERSIRYPEELRQAVATAEQTTRDQLVRKYEYDARLMQIEIESERKMYQQKISALEEQIDQYKSLKQMFSQNDE